MHEFEIATAPGVRLRVRAAGKQGPRVLLLHGFPEAAFVWDGVMAALAAEAQCWAPNLRGFAGSSAPTDPLAYKAKPLVGDLVALIGALGAPIDLLVAHDWGGALAWSLAAQRPALLRRLLIVNAPHPATFLRELRESPAQIAASAYMNWLCRPDAAARLAEDDYARLWRFFGAAAWLDAATRARYREAWSHGLEGPLAYYRNSPLRPAAKPDDPIHTLVLQDAAVTVTVPTTVLWGERDDALRPGLLDGLGRWVPDLHIERVAEASHWVVHEQPERVVATIRTLLP
jgi:pimeloyl-ACP methyl ester carboxylesterase